MAICIYSNGITEDYHPQSLVFSERELVNLFTEFKFIKTKRLITVLNTWCIYGYNDKVDAMDFNRIVSDILQEPVYGHALFVHDTEINHEWKASDPIIYRSYTEFLIDMKKLIDTAANDIIEEFRNVEGEDSHKMLPVLETLGPTKDKRVLFSFNPSDQFNEFYENEEFNTFAKKAYEYMRDHKQKEEPFTIYADKKAVIIIDTHNILPFMNKLMDKFKKDEQYEICNELTSLITTWGEIIKNPKHKKSQSSEI